MTQGHLQTLGIKVGTKAKSVKKLSGPFSQSSKASCQHAFAIDEMPAASAVKMYPLGWMFARVWVLVHILSY